MRSGSNNCWHTPGPLEDHPWGSFPDQLGAAHLAVKYSVRPPDPENTQNNPSYIARWRSIEPVGPVCMGDVWVVFGPNYGGAPPPPAGVRAPPLGERSE